MSDRNKLPNRRLCERHRFEHDGHRYHATVGYHPQTRSPTELFLQTSRTGTALEALARDSAVAVSLAIQYGCPVDIIRKAITRLDDGRAAGPIGELLDIIAKDQST